MNNNSISESLLQAISTMIGEGKQTVIECTIVSCDDPVIGEYTVNYQANEFKVYGNANSENTFTPGTNVYVIVPDGDFYKTKYILGVASPGQESEESENPSNAEKYVYISNNFFNVTNEQFKLQSYYPGEALTPLPGQEQVVSLTNNLLPTSLEGYTGLEELKYYLQDGYKTFHLNYSAKTELDYDQTYSEGQYGIRLTIPFVSGSKVYEIKSNKMNGSAKSYNDWAKNYFKIEIDNDLVFDPTGNITLEIFKDDKFLINKPAIDDIFLTNFSLYAVKYLSDTELSGYFLNIKASGSNYFTRTSSPDSSKTLTPELKANGIKVDNSKANFYWYEEDLRVNVNHIEYQPLAGVGWRCINTERAEIRKESAGGEGEIIGYTYTPQETLDIYARNIFDSKEYKCATPYNNQKVSNTIVITSHSEGYDFILETADGQTAYLPEAGPITLIAKFHYAGVTIDGNQDKISNIWLGFDKDGNELDSSKIVVKQSNILEMIDEKPYFVSKAEISSNIINNLLTIKFMSYANTDITISGGSTIPAQKSLGVRSLALTYKQEADFSLYNLFVTNGDKVYKYSSQGYSPMISSYEGSLGCKIETIDPIGFRIFTKDGVELDEDEQYPLCEVQWTISKNSLITPIVDEHSQIVPDDNYWIIKSSGHANLPYVIANYYDITKKNNAIELAVTYDGVTMYDYASLQMFKTGEQGTNGTGCLAYLRATTEGADDYYAYRELGKDNKEYFIELIAVKNNDTYTWYYKDLKTNKICSFDNVDDISFKPLVYKNGIKITSGYEITYDLYDNGLTNNVVDSIDLTTGTDIGVLKLKNAGSVKDNIIRATIKIDGLKLYCYYPIEIVEIDGSCSILNEDINTAIPDLTHGYSAVMYSSNGYDPGINSNESIFNINDNSTITVNSWAWDYNHNAFTEYHNELAANQCKLLPKDIKESNQSVFWISAEGTNTASDKPISVNTKVTYYRPILVYNDCYGLETLNDWDGTKLKIDNEGSYIFGAYSGWGVKHNDNTFTGVLLGSVYSGSTLQNGIFAYNHGSQTFKLDSATGALYIGESGKGQIQILPGSKALIQGGNYIDKDSDPLGVGSGMQIDLSAPTIKYGSQNFMVDANGNLTARNGDFKGIITATGGKIEGDLKVTTGSFIMSDDPNDPEEYYVTIEQGEIILYSVCAQSDNGAKRYPSSTSEPLMFYWNKRVKLTRQGFRVDNNLFNETLDATTSEDNTEEAYVGMSGIFTSYWDREREYGRINPGYHKGIVDINSDGLKFSHFDSPAGDTFNLNDRIYDLRIGHFKPTDEISSFREEINNYWDDQAAPKIPEEMVFLLQDPDVNSDKFLMMANDQMIMVGKNKTSKISPNLFAVANKLDNTVRTRVTDHVVNIRDYFYKNSPYKINDNSMYTLKNNDDVTPGSTELADGCFIIVYDGEDRDRQPLDLTILSVPNSIVRIKSEKTGETIVSVTCDSTGTGHYQGTDLLKYRSYYFNQVLVEIIAQVMTIDCRTFTAKLTINSAASNDVVTVTDSQGHVLANVNCPAIENN